jgi:hypothetical protein
MINKLTKGQRPTLLEADKGNELIDHINSLSQMDVKRGADTDKFVFGKNKSTLHLQDFPQNQSSSSSGTLEIDSADESVLITEVPNQPTDLKALTLNNLRAKDVLLKSPNFSVDIKEVPINALVAEIRLLSLSLNGLKAKDATISSQDNSVVIVTNEQEANIDLKALELNGIGGKNALLDSQNNSISVSSPINPKRTQPVQENQIDLKGMTLQNLGSKDVTLVSDDDSVSILRQKTDTNNPELDFKGLTLNDFKAEDVTIYSNSGIATVHTTPETNSIQVYVPPPIAGISTAGVDLVSENDSVEFTKKDGNVDLQALRINEWGGRDINLESATGTIQVRKRESIDGLGKTIYKLQLEGFDLNGIGHKRATLEAGTGLKVETAGQTITVSLDGTWQDIVVCENGVQRTMQVLVKNQTQS